MLIIQIVNFHQMNDSFLRWAVKAELHIELQWT